MGATVIAIIGLAAYRLARLAIARDRLRWAMVAVMALTTAWTESEAVRLPEPVLIAGGSLAGLLVVWINR